MSRSGRRSDIIWRIVLIAHLAAAAAWWWLMPGGFPPSNGHFWLNQILPIVVVAAALLARFNDAARPAVLAGICAMWVVAGIAARVVFPVSFGWEFLVVLVPAMAMAGLWVGSFGVRRLKAFWVVASAIFGVALGVLAPYWLAGAAPGTRPLSRVFAPFSPVPMGAARLDAPGVQVNVPGGNITLSAGRRSVGIQPLLSFSSRSPDACLVLLADEAARIGPPRTLTGAQVIGRKLEVSYADDGQSALGVDASAAPQRLEISAISSLPHTVWSHLNTFTELTIVGHRRLSVVFSPCPEARIEFKPMEYPAGAPARFAYISADGMFHVVEARSAEKGPFHALAAGQIDHEPLTLTLYDELTPFVQITFEDFVSQASTQLSPTGGWGVPENAIEFSLQGNDADAMASIFLTLAATSVGRGYDSVGHAPGVYRNQMAVTWLEPKAPASATAPASAAAGENDDVLP
jgi:hypothetical protein